MPELPDVEGFRRILAAHSGDRIRGVTVDDPGVLRGIGARRLAQTLKGRRFLEPRRCWRGRVNPLRAAGDLDEDDRRALYGAMRRVLRDSIKVGRVPSRGSWLTGVRDEPDGACPRCGMLLSGRRVSGRRTVWCPRCQPT